MGHCSGWRSKSCISFQLLIQVENDAHCDFVHLREMILRTNLEDLRSTTHTKHYEVCSCEIS